MKKFFKFILVLVLFGLPGVLRAADDAVEKKKVDYPYEIPGRRGGGLWEHPACIDFLTYLNRVKTPPVENCRIQLTKEDEAKGFRSLGWQSVDLDTYFHKIMKAYETYKDLSFSGSFRAEELQKVLENIADPLKRDEFPMLKLEKAIVTMPGTQEKLLFFKLTFRPCDAYEFPSIFVLTEDGGTKEDLMIINQLMNFDGGDVFYYKDQLVRVTMRMDFDRSSKYYSFYLNNFEAPDCDTCHYYLERIYCAYQYIPILNPYFLTH